MLNDLYSIKKTLNLNNDVQTDITATIFITSDNDKYYGIQPSTDMLNSESSKDNLPEKSVEENFIFKADKNFAFQTSQEFDFRYNPHLIDLKNVDLLSKLQTFNQTSKLIKIINNKRRINLEDLYSFGITAKEYPHKSEKDIAIICGPVGFTECIRKITLALQFTPDSIYCLDS
ncbi:hypothetical protein BB561_006752 [Smittium simulii]|uniref:Uncharacterized protein n=1 Tax=Smittium simulii TaxID=133385 RepID=A0A2T9Y1T8_9FUNG|nr:hypothetical protein BB561_006752 [Smittium simulii]